MEEPTKRCCTCHVVQPVSELNVRRAATDGLQSRCRTCNRAWYERYRVEHMANVKARNQRQRKRNKRQMAAYLLEHPCVDCGEADVRCLDFDHRDPQRKRANVGKLLADAQAWSRIQAEIDECDVRCANCHRRVTSERASWWREQVQLDARAAVHQQSVARLARVLGG